MSEDWWESEYCRCFYSEDDDKGYCINCGNWINYKERNYE